MDYPIMFALCAFICPWERVYARVCIYECVYVCLFASVRSVTQSAGGRPPHHLSAFQKEINKQTTLTEFNSSYLRRHCVNQSVVHLNNAVCRRVILVKSVTITDRLHSSLVIKHTMTL